jgi:hypothetical protein
MSVDARLHIKGHDKEEKGIKVLSSNFSFSQDTDEMGRTASIVRAGLIHLTIPGIYDTEILQWMLGRDIKRNGEIKFTSLGAMEQQRRSLKFEDGMLVNYQESFSENSEVIIKISISCRKIICGDESNMIESWWGPDTDKSEP